MGSKPPSRLATLERQPDTNRMLDRYVPSLLNHSTGTARDVKALYLASESRELENMECFIKDRCIVGDIDKHGNLSLPHPLSLANKVVLEETGQLAVSKGNQPLLITPESKFICTLVLNEYMHLQVF